MSEVSGEGASQQDIRAEMERSNIKAAAFVQQSRSSTDERSRAVRDAGSLPRRTRQIANQVKDELRQRGKG